VSRLAGGTLLSIAFVTVVGFLGLRWYERAVTFHPARHAPGDERKLPDGGEDSWFAGLHGWFVRATSQPADGTVIYMHGNAGDICSVGWIGGAMAARGFDVLLFDYSGYGRSQGETRDESDLYAAADAAYDYVVNVRGAHSRRLALWGQSLGSAAAIDLASRRACRALVVESGLSSGSDMAIVMLPWLPRWLHRVARNRFDSVRKLKSVHCPVLVTHGEADDTIPVDQGRALFAAANEPKRLLVIQDAGHDVAGAGGNDYIDIVAGFLRAVVRNE
jgi:hypothetical protein